jgi:hypothetical protein
MSKGDLVTFEMMSKMEKTFSSLPRAEEAGIFSILLAVRSSPDISKLDMVRKSFGFEKIPQDFSPSRIKAKIDKNRKEFVMDGDSFTSFVKEVE